MKKILLCSIFLVFSTVLFAQQTEEKFKPVTGIDLEFNYGFVGDNAYTFGMQFGVSRFFTESLYSTLTAGYLNSHFSGYGYSMEAYYIPIQLGLGCSLGTTNFSIDPHIIASLNCGLKGAETGLGIKIGAGLNIYGLGLVGRYNFGRDNSDGYYEIALRFGI